MNDNPLRKLEEYGQSIWLDYLRRGMMVSGELKQVIDEDGLSGVTSNPSIFEKAIAGSHDYDETIQTLAREGKSAEEIYQEIVIEDLTRAADLFRPVYDRTGGHDGFVSLEVSPYLANDTYGSVAEGRRYWQAVNRPNLMIKIPATREGLQAIQQLTADGINVNITLLFGLGRYLEVTDAYILGLEALRDNGYPINSSFSVASFFLSRIDVLLDPVIEKIIQNPENEKQQAIAQSVHGQVAIASAKVAYHTMQEVFGSRRFQDLAKDNPKIQKLLWASTSTKNPAYKDTMYVEPLIGPETINTLPLETINAYRDHGNPAPRRIEEDLGSAREVLDKLPALGINLDAATQQLEDEGVKKFKDAYDKLIAVLEEKRKTVHQTPLDRQVLPSIKDGGQGVQHIQKMEQEHYAERLWRKDASLWSSDPKEQEQITGSLGWLHVADKMEESLKHLTEFAEAVWKDDFQHVVDLGMGGSSLAPLVLARSFPHERGLPLSVLDSTDPGAVLRLENQIPLDKTLFIVASKSGTTAEPLAFERYFYERVKSVKGVHAGDNFVAITDPGTPLEKLAADKGYRKVFTNFPDIGGRYSALSYFGLVPAALMGIDVSELLGRAQRMAHACDGCVPAVENPGLSLGAVLGELAAHGRDKVTFLMPEQISTLAMWLEQLLAESTGKEGKGLLPVAGEAVGPPSVYGDDRVFVYFRLRNADDSQLTSAVRELEDAGHPVIRIQMDDLYDIGQEFFRWEVAVAAAGSVLGINPFDQPNVQESKDNTNRILADYHQTGHLEEPEPSVVYGPLQIFTRQPVKSASDAIHRFLKETKPGDYVVLMAFMEETPRTEKILEKIRIQLRDALHLATTLGYGPRFLHSTGQFHKGGPNTGHFLQIIDQDKEDVPVPGLPYTFALLKRAQALGDFQSLVKHGREIERISIGEDLPHGLDVLEEVETDALL